MIRAKAKPLPSAMNKTEAAWARELEARKRGGELVWYEFEPMKLRLGAGCFYSPDFLALEPDGGLVFWEVKGFWRDDARAKIKAAATRFPMFRFVAVQRGKRGGPVWELEEIQAVTAQLAEAG